MENSELIRLINIFDKMNIKEKELFLSKIALMDEKQRVGLVLEEYNYEIICPRCSCPKVWRWGEESGLQRFKCQGCNKSFNCLSCTPLARLRIKEIWLEFSQTMLDGKSVRKISEELGINKNTAFKWRHLFLRLISRLKGVNLTGIVEMDDFRIRKSQKGSRNLKREPRKRGGKAKKKAEKDAFVKVVVAQDRSLNVTDFMTNKIQGEELCYELLTHINPDAVLCSDGAKAFKSFAVLGHLSHKQLNIKKGVRVIEKAYHIQTVNSYHSKIKTWIRRFNGVATKYLENYLGWHRWIDQNKRNCLPQLWLLSAFNGFAPNPNQRLTDT